jgi:hypothetical protein
VFLLLKKKINDKIQEAKPIIEHLIIPNYKFQTSAAILGFE